MPEKPRGGVMELRMGGKKYSIFQVGTSHVVELQGES